MLTRDGIRLFVVHCKRAAYDEYIGRSSRGTCGKWGNRYSHKASSVPGVVVVESRQAAVRRYAEDLVDGIASGAVNAGELAGLSGKVLGCWCAPALCHGHVLAAAAHMADELIGMDKVELSKAVEVQLQRVDLL